jgi:Uma2 family endonuclease
MPGRLKLNPKPRTGDVSFEEFCQCVTEDQKADLIDGVIYMASPENTDANDLYGWLFSILRFYVAKKKLGRIFGSRVAFQLSEYNAPEPDIAFVRRDHMDRVTRGRVHGPPDLAIEIVSPESVERDYEKKRERYQEFGVTEYWIIDEHEEHVHLLRLGRDGAYREARPRKGVLTSQVVTGFWLKTEWLWQQPRPDEPDVWDEILRGPP